MVMWLLLAAMVAKAAAHFNGDCGACAVARKCLRDRHACVVACYVSVHPPHLDASCATECIHDVPGCMSAFATSCAPIYLDQPEDNIPDYVWTCHDLWMSSFVPASVIRARHLTVVAARTLRAAEWMFLVGVVVTTFVALAVSMRPYARAAWRTLRVWCSAHRCLGRGEVCPVCRDDGIAHSQRMMCTTCQQLYHRECWGEWREFQRQSSPRAPTCPTCRTTMEHDCLTQACASHFVVPPRPRSVCCTCCRACGDMAIVMCITLAIVCSFVYWYHWTAADLPSHEDEMDAAEYCAVWTW